MTELLRQVFSEIEKLPPTEQDAIALRLMAELQDERKWNQQFKSTTDEQWDKLAESVRREITNGDISALEEIFPVDS